MAAGDRGRPDRGLVRMPGRPAAADPAGPGRPDHQHLVAAGPPGGGARTGRVLRGQGRGLEPDAPARGRGRAARDRRQRDLPRVHRDRRHARAGRGRQARGGTPADARITAWGLRRTWPGARSSWPRPSRSSSRARTSSSTGAPRSRGDPRVRLVAREPTTHGAALRREGRRGHADAQPTREAERRDRRDATGSGAATSRRSTTIREVRVVVVRGAGTPRLLRRQRHLRDVGADAGREAGHRRDGGAPPPPALRQARRRDDPRIRARRRPGAGARVRPADRVRDRAVRTARGDPRLDSRRRRDAVPPAARRPRHGRLSPLHRGAHRRDPGQGDRPRRRPGPGRRRWKPRRRGSRP